MPSPKNKHANMRKLGFRVMAIFTLIWSVATFGLAAWCWHRHGLQSQTAAWPTTEGTVLEAKMVHDISRDVREARVSYRYEHQGQRHTSKTLRFAVLFDIASEKWVQSHQPNDRVVVHVNPDNPSQSVLFAGMQPGDWFSWLFVCTLAHVWVALLGMTAYHAMFKTNTAGNLNIQPHPQGQCLVLSQAKLRHWLPAIPFFSACALLACMLGQVTGLVPMPADKAMFQSQWLTCLGLGTLGMLIGCVSAKCRPKKVLIKHDGTTVFRPSGKSTQTFAPGTIQQFIVEGQQLTACVPTDTGTRHVRLPTGGGDSDAMAAWLNEQLDLKA